MTRKTRKHALMALLMVILLWNGFVIGMAAGYRLAPDGIHSTPNLFWPFFGAIVGMVAAILAPIVFKGLAVALSKRLQKTRLALAVFLSLALPWPGMLLGGVVGYILGWHLGGAMIGASVGFLAPWLVAVVVSAFQSKERVYEQS